MKIYTKTGDLGQTSLFGGTRVTKDDARIEAYGTVDELSSFLGVARASQIPAEVNAVLEQVQRDLFDVGAHLASPGTSRFAGVDAQRIQDALVGKVPGLENNVPQGGVVWVFAVKK